MTRPLSELDIEGIARVAHEANRALCTAQGDDSHQPWDETPESVRAGLRAGVAFIAANPHVTPRELHDEWMKARWTAGWVLGEQKDPVRKTHPNLVPFASLPLHQQLKDHLFGGIVRIFLAFADATTDYDDVTS